jgi:hypothetical protein
VIEVKRKGQSRRTTKRKEIIYSVALDINHRDNLICLLFLHSQKIMNLRKRRLIVIIR